MLDWTYKKIRRLVITVIGATLLLIGVALLVLPGPGLLFILASLAVLAIEFVWARTLLRRLKEALPTSNAQGGEGLARGDGRREDTERSP
ncbi:MAG: PGPGW domain-containing protein [Acidobacteriota bacterium]|nr:PGPGW domain-containing protein [Acidobacteriota bacterium]